MLLESRRYKDPALLFYTADWLVGTMYMSKAQKGAYIDMICYQHQHGHIPNMVFGKMLEGLTDPEAAGVKDKWKQDSNGAWYSSRVDIEIHRRKDRVLANKRDRDDRGNFLKKVDVLPDAGSRSGARLRAPDRINEDEDEDIIKKKEESAEVPTGSSQDVVVIDAPLQTRSDSTQDVVFMSTNAIRDAYIKMCQHANHRNPTLVDWKKYKETIKQLGQIMTSEQLIEYYQAGILFNKAQSDAGLTYELPLLNLTMYLDSAKLQQLQSAVPVVQQMKNSRNRKASDETE